MRCSAPFFPIRQPFQFQFQRLPPLCRSRLALFIQTQPITLLILLNNISHTTPLLTSTWSSTPVPSAPASAPPRPPRLPMVLPRRALTRLLRFATMRRKTLGSPVLRLNSALSIKNCCSAILIKPARRLSSLYYRSLRGGTSSLSDKKSLPSSTFRSSQKPSLERAPESG